jgi:hypothetical protein
MADARNLLLDLPSDLFIDFLLVLYLVEVGSFFLGRIGLPGLLNLGLSLG